MIAVLKMFQHSSKQLLQSVCKKIIFPKSARWNSSVTTDTVEPKKSDPCVNVNETDNLPENEDVVQVERFGAITIIGLNREGKSILN